MARPKPKVPVYPRPVSPLSAESPPATKDDVYPKVPEERPSENVARADKRRRIEMLAKHYLRGNELFIMSAALKGPLDGWVNPWLERPMLEVSKLLDQPEISQGENITACTRLAKLSNSLNTQNFGTNAFSSKMRDQQRVANTSVSQQTIQPRTTTRWQAQDVSPTSTMVPARTGQSNTPKRTYNVHNEPSLPSGQLGYLPAYRSTPTSSTRTNPKTISSPVYSGPRDQEKVSHGLEPTFQTQGKPIAGEFDSKSTLDQRELGDGKDDRPPETNIHVSSSHLHLPAFRGRNTAGKAILKEDSRETENDCEIHTMTDKTAAGHAQDWEGPLRNKYSNAARNNTKQDPPQNPPENDTVSAKSATGCSQRSRHIPLEPNLPLRDQSPTQPSGSTIVNQLPSAQEVRSIPGCAVESIPSAEGKFLASPKGPGKASFCLPSGAASGIPNPYGPFPLAQYDQYDNNSNISGLQAMSPRSKPSHITTPRRNDGITPFITFKSPPNHISNFETQDILSEITPLDFRTLKSIQLFDCPDNITAGTTSRPDSKKRKKHASHISTTRSESLPTGTQQCSIKSALGVSKKALSSGTKFEHNATKNKNHQLCLVGLDKTQTSDETHGTRISGYAHSTKTISPPGEASVRNPQEYIIGAQVSLSAPTEPNSAFGMSMTSALHQDAQAITPRNPASVRPDLEVLQNGFDLNSAVDELGSFLGSWDPNKEALDLDGPISSISPNGNRICERIALQKSSMNVSGP